MSLILRFPNGVTATFHAAKTLASAVSEGNEERLSSPFDVLAAEVNANGFVMVIGLEPGRPDYGKCFRYCPNGFQEFLLIWEKTGVTRQQIFDLDTDGTAKLLCAFIEWADERNADNFIRDIRAGLLTVNDARKIRPDVFNRPRFADFIAGDLPPGKRGKRAAHRPDEFELYALACKFYRESTVLSLLAACDKAITQRPDLVPDSWDADEAPETLKRRVANYWDKSIYTHYCYRMSGEKAHRFNKRP
ncbi:hypothetical protein D3C87_806910 [compost metagenome]|uniref:hypothetical protein n=1 Tax=Pseudomonas sp. ACN5 TaxID=1920427 RepID=UPI000BB37F19|nr:hypothetical protein [Pseudomonas sp. ACN5]PBJ07739.1 hypothetical protein BSF40_19340 [Pseudomonas sp. ACN5]